MTELVCAGRDDDLAALIDRAETAAEALQLRRAAEAAAATVRIGRSGSKAWARLFIVSIVIGFDDEIPATHVDPLLRRTVQAGRSCRELEMALRRRFGDALVLDELFELDGLLRLPLSAVRRASEAMAAGDLAVAGRALGAPDEHPVRRSGTFARCLIGQQKTVAKPLPIAEVRLQRMKTHLAEGLRARIGALPNVDVRLGADFFEGLFAAMQRYQDARLAQICRRAAQRLGARVPVGACLSGLGTPSSTGADLLLTNAETQCEVSRHRIFGRPGIPLDATMRRIEATLRRNGVARIETVACKSAPRGPAGTDFTDGRKTLFAIEL